MNCPRLVASPGCFLAGNLSRHFYNGATSPRSSGSWGSSIRGFASMVGSSSSSNSQGVCLFPPAFGRGQAYFGSRSFLTSSEECDRTCSRSASPGFYGRLCVVPKSTGGWRPVLDLSPLNVFLRKFPFCMETPVSVRDFVRDGDWATSFDLTDVYFHISHSRVLLEVATFHVERGVLPVSSSSLRSLSRHLGVHSYSEGTVPSHWKQEGPTSMIGSSWQVPGSCVTFTPVFFWMCHFASGFRSIFGSRISALLRPSPSWGWTSTQSCLPSALICPEFSNSRLFSLAFSRGRRPLLVP